MLRRINKNILYLVGYFSIALTFFFIINVINKRDKVLATYQELSEIDSTLLVNEMLLKKPLSAESSNSTTRIFYKPIDAIEQTYKSSSDKISNPYKLNLRETNTTPELIEARINRVKVSLTNYYAVPKDARLISLKFNNQDGSKYLFSTTEFGTYEDFCNENTLYIHVPNGKIDLYIRAIDNINKTVTKYKRVTVYSKTPISKNALFWPLMTLIALSPFLYYFLRLKLNKQKILLAEQKSLEMQRYKISADLHDEIGSSLSSLQINSSIANFLFENSPEEAQDILKKIENQSEHLSDKIGDIIWSMKPGEEEFLTLTSRIKNFTNDILGSTDIKYEIKIDPKIDSLVKDIAYRKNIILFVKEAINNVAKYSRASALAILIAVENKCIKISISDNGVGFDVSKIKGNGVGNMQKRIEEMSGVFAIDSVTGSGTTVSGTIPFVP